MGMKKTQVGMIPEEWGVQSFSETFRILNNNTFSRAELNYDSGQFKNIHYGDVLILFPEVLDCTREDVPFINDEVRISGSAQPLQDGDIVMAAVDGNYTLKIYRKRKNEIYLEAADAAHSIIRPKESLEIFGIATGITRKLK